MKGKWQTDELTLQSLVNRLNRFLGFGSSAAARSSPPDDPGKANGDQIYYFRETLFNYKKLKTGSKSETRTTFIIFSTPHEANEHVREL